jgi:hypothetical protein
MGRGNPPLFIGGIMNVEFLLAWDDGTWTTEVLSTNLPDEMYGNDAEAVRWFLKNEISLEKYRKLVAPAIYCWIEEDDSDIEYPSGESNCQYHDKG